MHSASVFYYNQFTSKSQHLFKMQNEGEFERMEKFSQWMLRQRKAVVFLFGVLAALCAVLAQSVRVDYNMMHYLPQDAPSTTALDVMDTEYTAKTANCRIMVEDVTIPRALALKEQLARLPGVSDVTWLDDYADVYAPLETQDSNTVESWYKDGKALFTCRVDEDGQYEHLMAIRAVVGEEAAMSGEAVNTGMATESTTREIRNVMLFALPVIFLILLITTTSWFEPVLFMATIGIAILLNMGTNRIFGTISFVTNAAGSVLQLAVSMDYSIFLLHSFSRFRQSGMDVQDAMAHAVKDSFSSVTASALTTVIGFAALILMRFRIGPDMGVVMAKSIVLSLVCVLVFLPCMAVMCCGLIDKTRHRGFLPAFRGFSHFVIKVRVPVLILFLLLAVPAFSAKSRIDFAYGSSEIYGDASTQIGADAIRINDTFGRSNQIVCMVPKGNAAREKALVEALEAIPEVTEVLSYAGTVGGSIPEEYFPAAQRDLLISEHYTRMVISTSVGVDGEIPFAVAGQLRDAAQQYYPDRYLMAGEAINTLDMRDVVTEDDIVVNGIAVGAIFLILLVNFRSLTLPVILVALIESAIWMNLAVPYLTGERLNYIAYLIINSVQLGATVDYAILFTNKYLENRHGNSRTHAARITVRETIVSILTSGSILCIAGTVLGAMSTNGVISQLGYLVGRGAALSCCIVLFVLPTCLCLFDPLIQKTSIGLHFEKN